MLIEYLLCNTVNTGGFMMSAPPIQLNVVVPSHLLDQIITLIMMAMVRSIKRHQIVGALACNYMYFYQSEVYIILLI